MLAIRKKLLQKHEALGVIHNQPDSYFANLQTEEVRSRLFELHESFNPCDAIEILREKLKQISRQRFLKVWHDHATVAGHGHLLILFSWGYDPAFYHTSDKMKAKTGLDIDVENPEIHILAHSGSSLDDQINFSQTHRKCLKDLMISLQTTTGTKITQEMPQRTHDQSTNNNGNKNKGYMSFLSW